MPTEKKQTTTNGWIVAAGSMVVVALSIFAWFFKKLPPEIPWLYSLPWGEQRLINKVWFGLGLGGVLLALGGCAFLSKLISKEDIRASVMVSRGGFFLTVLYLLSFFQVLRLMI